MQSFQRQRTCCGRTEEAIFRSTCRKASRRRDSAGFTILELLVCVAVVGLLAALLLPALSSAREAARRLTCVNQMKQIGLALHCYHEEFQVLPSAWQWDQSQTSAYGWLVPLLSGLEQQPVYRAMDCQQSVYDAANDAARHTTLRSLICPSDVTEPSFTLFEENETPSLGGPLIDLPTASYIGVYGTFEPDDELPTPRGDGVFAAPRPTSFAQFHRGLSQTFVVGERTMARVASTWLGIDFRGEDAACRILGSAATHPNCRECDECEFDSRHDGGANFLWADGHVGFVSEQIDSARYREFARLSTNYAETSSLTN